MTGSPEDRKNIDEKCTTGENVTDDFEDDDIEYNDDKCDNKFSGSLACVLLSIPIAILILSISICVC